RLVHRLEVLRAVFDPANRFAKMPGGKGNQKIFRIEFTAGAKAAADFRLDEVNTALRQADEVGENAPMGMVHLGWTPHGQKPASLVPLRNQAAILQRNCGM